ncbi:TadE/TadG family type IV pilus assembly protein [Acetobacter nitrogenifigens]|uniref:TadE/TadG family type IV pilus assembly protein n=1 Tax=Acetobacter nitrogenifigens TaxID=285268 RepID=UPI0006879347|nr:TadE/TadG family type IV pilus assembly protein [Acetobacter nitrogenifigens]
MIEAVRHLQSLSGTLIRRFRAQIRFDALRRPAFLADRSGAAAVEFAMVALPFLTLIVATVVISFIYFSQATLDAVAEEASRLILTGQAPASGQGSAFKSLACGMLPSYMTCDNLMVNVQAVASYSDIDAAAPNITFNASGQVSNSWSYDPGAPGGIVVLQLMYMLPVISGMDGFSPSNMPNGTKLLVSTVVIKVEPSS